MASVSASKLACFVPGGNTNVALTPDGTNLPAPVAGAVNIEVFTQTSGSLAPGYQASVFIQGAVSLNGNPVNNPIQAATLTSTEQLLAGNFQMIDQTGSELIQM